MKPDLRELAHHPLRAIRTHKEIRYLIAGTASEGIEYVSFLFLITQLPHAIYFSNSLSFLLGVGSGFIFHKLWTFRGEHQFKTYQQFVGYVSLAGVNFVAINAFLGLYIHFFDLSPAMAKLLAIATTVVWTYLITNLFIFKNKA